MISEKCEVQIQFGGEKKEKKGVYQKALVEQGFYVWSREALEFGMLGEVFWLGNLTSERSLSAKRRKRSGTTLQEGGINPRCI